MLLSKFDVQLLFSDVVVVAAASIAGKRLSASCRCHLDRKMPRGGLDVLERLRGSAKHGQSTSQDVAAVAVADVVVVVWLRPCWELMCYSWWYCMKC